jgi:hypothetical protein
VGELLGDLVPSNLNSVALFDEGVCLSLKSINVRRSTGACRFCVQRIEAIPQVRQDFLCHSKPDTRMIIRYPQLQLENWLFPAPWAALSNHVESIKWHTCTEETLLLEYPCRPFQDHISIRTIRHNSKPVISRLQPQVSFDDLLHVWRIDVKFSGNDGNTDGGSILRWGAKRRWFWL